MTGIIASVVREAKAFPANMRELLAAPGTLLLFLIGVGLLIYVSTSALMFSVFSWVIIFFGYVSYNIFLYHKAGYQLGWLRRIVLAVLCTVLIAGSAYSYEVVNVNNIHLAAVPAPILKKNQWSRFPDQDSSESAGAYLVRVEIRGYRYDYLDPAAPPYPGAIWLVTAKTVFIPDQNFMRNEVEQRINGFSMQGLSIDKQSKTEGQETIGDGHQADYATYQATLETGGSGFFREVSAGAKILVRAEWWACNEQGTAVIVLSAAQWGVIAQGGIGGRIGSTPPDNLDTVNSVQRIIYNIRCD